MYQVYEAISGDTFDSLASRLGISSDELIRINGFNSFNVGDLIVVPNSSMYFSYIVKSGDSMYSIAQMYNQDLNDLYLINGIKEGDFIYPNQELLIPKDNVSIYYTKDGDSISDIYDLIDVSSSDLLLVPDQIIVYRKS